MRALCSTKCARRNNAGNATSCSWQPCRPAVSMGTCQHMYLTRRAPARQLRRPHRSLGTYCQRLQSLCQALSNLLRPSAHHISQEAPRVMGKLVGCPQVAQQQFLGSPGCLHRCRNQVLRPQQCHLLLLQSMALQAWLGERRRRKRLR